jgi:hypothetical protein
MLVVDEDQLVAERGVGEADAARISRLAGIGDLPHRARFRQFGVGHLEQRRETLGRQAADPKAHGWLLMLIGAT